MTNFLAFLIFCLLPGWVVFKKVNDFFIQRKLASIMDGDVVTKNANDVSENKIDKLKSYLGGVSSPDFIIIYGVKNIIIACVLTICYVIFVGFCCLTFNASPVMYVLSMGGTVATAIYIVIKKYKKAFSDYFEIHFPYALRLISRNLGVGQTLYTSIDSAALNLNGIMQREFKRISLQLKTGISFEEILDKGEIIYPYKGYYVFSSYLKISVQKGSSLKDTLMSLADDLISSQIIKKKTRALTSESRGAAFILATLPAIMLGIMYAFSQANFNYLFTALYGRYVLIYVVTSVSLGFVIISRMIKKVEL
ncbi:hypothetical protein GWD52_20005 [Enterobacteriaceae bacterium 4M9]|nr:hypothetical protein [Enterobacteriaceae bacterium 4M9]